MKKTIAKKTTAKKRAKAVVEKPVASKKEKPIKKVAKKEIKKPAELEIVVPVKSARYFEAVGRRKTAVARVRLSTQGDKECLINEKPYQQYFPTLELQETAISSLNKMKCQDKFRVSVKVGGGGINAQAEAVRHGTARALVEFNPDFRKRLRRVGYLTRDPRKRERKKFGLKRARRAPQWQKR